MLQQLVATLPAFASFFLGALVLLSAFVGLYMLVTPYNEFKLIREGNEAAAFSLGGALIGFALPLAFSVAVNHSLLAMLAWGVVAGGVQLLVFIGARIVLPQINENISQGRLASGIFLALLSIAVGIINAGCIA